MIAEPRCLLITGASSGIGAALAKCYAAPGITLVLTGRNGDRLNNVAQTCRDAGAATVTEVIDVADRAAMAAFIARVDTTSPIDLVIANAGISGGISALKDFDAHLRAIFAVNVDGVFNTIHPLLPHFIRRGHGQVAIVSSMAGFRGMPGAVAYCASKAATRAYGEGLRGKLAPQGIAVSTILPGFVRSRMTARNRFPMPFLMDSDRAARIIRRGLAANRGRIAFPWPIQAMVWLGMLLPDRLIEAMTRQLPEKN